MDAASESFDSTIASRLDLARRAIHSLGELRYDPIRQGLQHSEWVHRMGRMVPTISDDLKHLFVNMRVAGGMSLDVARAQLGGIMRVSEATLPAPEDRLPQQEMSTCQSILAQIYANVREDGEPGPLGSPDWINDTLELIRHIQDAIQRRAVVGEKRFGSTLVSPASSKKARISGQNPDSPIFLDALTIQDSPRSSASGTRSIPAAIITSRTSSGLQATRQAVGYGEPQDTSPTAVNIRQRTTSSRSRGTSLSNIGVAPGQQASITPLSSVQIGKRPVAQTGHEEGMQTRSRRGTFASTGSTSGRTEQPPGPQAGESSNPPSPFGRPRPILAPDAIIIVTLEEVLEECDFFTIEGGRIPAAALNPAVLEAIKPHLEPFRSGAGWPYVSSQVRTNALHCARHKLGVRSHGVGKFEVTDTIEPCSSCMAWGVPCMRRHRDEAEMRVLVVPTTLRRGVLDLKENDPKAWVNIPGMEEEGQDEES